MEALNNAAKPASCRQPVRSARLTKGVQFYRIRLLKDCFTPALRRGGGGGAGSRPPVQEEFAMVQVSLCSPRDAPPPLPSLADRTDHRFPLLHDLYFSRKTFPPILRVRPNSFGRAGPLYIPRGLATCFLGCICTVCSSCTSSVDHL